MHPVEQHVGHSLQTLGHGGQPLDWPSNGAVDHEQHFVHCLTLHELPLNLS